MKIVKLLENKDLRVSFEGNTYIFSKDKKDKPVYVIDALEEHLKERYPMAFEFNVKAAKSAAIPKVASEKTVVRFGQGEGTEDMKITSHGQQSPTFAQGDITPSAGVTDGDGIGWYGKGLEIEQI